jgi:hypothetical protein
VSWAGVVGTSTLLSSPSKEPAMHLPGVCCLPATCRRDTSGRTRARQDSSRLSCHLLTSMQCYTYYGCAWNCTNMHVYACLRTDMHISDNRIARPDCSSGPWMIARSAVEIGPSKRVGHSSFSTQLRAGCTASILSQSSPGSKFVYTSADRFLLASHAWASLQVLLALYVVIGWWEE